MHELKFDWDERKAATNLRKHRVSFEEARLRFLTKKPWSSKTPIIPRRRIGSSSWV